MIGLFIFIFILTYFVNYLLGQECIQPKHNTHFRLYKSDSHINGWSNGYYSIFRLNENIEFLYQGTFSGLGLVQVDLHCLDDNANFLVSLSQTTISNDIEIGLEVCDKAFVNAGQVIAISIGGSNGCDVMTERADYMTIRDKQANFGVINELLEVSGSYVYTPSNSPTNSPFINNIPSSNPTDIPTLNIPSALPTTSTSTSSPSNTPTNIPFNFPTNSPTNASPASSNPPTNSPTIFPTSVSSGEPTCEPSLEPSYIPIINPSNYPTNIPSYFPSILLTDNPSSNPSIQPSNNPSVSPTINPSICPTVNPTIVPTVISTNSPSNCPTTSPSIYSKKPTIKPTSLPSVKLTSYPTSNPTLQTLEFIVSYPVSQTLSSSNYITNSMLNSTKTSLTTVLYETFFSLNVSKIAITNMSQPMNPTRRLINRRHLQSTNYLFLNYTLTFKLSNTSNEIQSYSNQLKLTIFNILNTSVSTGYFTVLLQTSNSTVLSTMTASIIPVVSSAIIESINSPTYSTGNPSKHSSSSFTFIIVIVICCIIGLFIISVSIYSYKKFFPNVDLSDKWYQIENNRREYSQKVLQNNSTVEMVKENDIDIYSVFSKDDNISYPMNVESTSNSNINTVPNLNDEVMNRNNSINESIESVTFSNPLKVKNYRLKRRPPSPSEFL